jgi:hypothetical protein
MALKHFPSASNDVLISAPSLSLCLFKPLWDFSLPARSTNVIVLEFWFVWRKESTIKVICISQCMQLLCYYPLMHVYRFYRMCKQCRSRSDCTSKLSQLLSTLYAFWFRKSAFNPGIWLFSHGQQCRSGSASTSVLSNLDLPDVLCFTLKGWYYFYLDKKWLEICDAPQDFWPGSFDVVF